MEFLSGLASTLTNSGSITGGAGGFGPTLVSHGGGGGLGIYGSHVTITNESAGQISGGTGSSGGSGGSGGSGIGGANLTIINDGTITGANGIGLGGNGITGADLNIITSGRIAGGRKLINGAPDGVQANAINSTAVLTAQVTKWLCHRWCDHGANDE